MNVQTLANFGLFEKRGIDLHINSNLAHDSQKTATEKKKQFPHHTYVKYQDIVSEKIEFLRYSQKYGLFRVQCRFHSVYNKSTKHSGSKSIFAKNFR